MNGILSLEQISDIDTFTLEQKIQQLQKHPYARLYEQLINIAKLELSQRYKVQEFGRMLINDQIQVTPIIPEINFKSNTQINSKKIVSKSQRFADILKRSLITDQKQLTIGKAACGNYKHTIRQPASTTRQKKNSVGPTKNTQNRYGKNSQVKKKPSLPRPSIPLPSLKTIKNEGEEDQKVKILKKQGKKVQSHLSTAYSTNVISIKKQQYGIQQQIIIPDKKESKKIQQKPKIKYIENDDVYDGQKLILDAPQKLTDIKIEPETSETSVDDDKQQKSFIQSDQIKEDIKANQSVLYNESKIKQQIEESQKLPIHKQYQNKNKQIQNQSNVLLQSNLKQKERGLHFFEQQTQIHNQAHKEDKQERLQLQNKQFNKPYKNDMQTIKTSQIQNKSQTQVIKQSQQSLENQGTSVQSSKPKIKLNINNNKGKSISKSGSNMNVSKSSRTIGVCSKKQEQHNQLQDNIDIINPTFQIVQLKNNTKIQNKTSMNFAKNKKVLSTTQQIKNKAVPMIQTPQRSVLVTFPYHQIIPSFSKLFPHAKSMINDLRSIQKQLQDHIHKKINELSLNDQYLRIRQQQLLFQTVSQSQKASRLKHIFNIDLQGFMHRSHIMMDRIKKNNNNPNQQNMLLYRVVRQKQDVYDIVNNTFHRTENWFQLPHGMDLKTSWNLLWTWSKPQIDIKQLFYFQKVNHFFGNKQIARKDLLKKNIQRIKKLGTKTKTVFDIIPQTYFLPGQNMQFVRKFREYSMKAGLNYWIMKPVGLSRGRGIELVSKIQDIVFSEPVVIQKYLSNPLLLDGHKFDMRIYVLVTSINPLQAYVYRQGFARISTQKYSLQDQDIHNKFIHLTNFSVQKQNLSEQEQSNTNTSTNTNTNSNTNIRNKSNFSLSSFQKQIGGCKITLKMLKQKLSHKGIAWQQIQQQIDSIIIKSLVSTMNVIQQNPNCFQLFGYDIIIDDNLKCWLIQVNSSPSLQKDFTIDQVIKQQLLDDIIQIVDPVPYDRQRLLQVVRRRRKQLQGYKSHINTQNNSIAQLNADLHYILHGRALRRYGEVCGNKNFKRLAPGQMYQNIIKIVQQYKISSITKQDN